MSPEATRGDEAEALVWSACSAMAGTARALLDSDPRLARYDLATAAVCGEAEIIDRLMRADSSRANTFFTPLGRTPLHYATFSRLGRGDPERQAGLRETVRVLLEHGADPNLWYVHDGWVQAPIYGAAGIAGDAEMTRMLLDAGAHPNDVGPDHAVGEALYHAAELPDPECARQLIEAGTAPAAVSHCLSRALDFDNPGMVEAFCDAGAEARASHLSLAAWRRRGPTCVGALVRAGAPVDVPDPRHGLTPLQIARRWGDGDVVELLTVAGAEAGDDPDLDAEAEARLRDAMLLHAVERGDADDVRRMLDAGARPDGDPEVEDPPLRQACWRGRVAIVAELLGAGASRDFSDGGTALGATRHGAGHCNDPQGGPTMAPAEEIDPAPYAEIERLLGDVPGTAAGRRQPD